VHQARRILRNPVFAVVAVTILAGTLRFGHLGTPDQRVFDEVYYSKAGCLYVGYSDARCGVRSSDEHFWARKYGDVASWVHPPVGKWMIGLGELAFGTGADGWRVASAAAGTLMVTFIAMLAYLLWGKTSWTYVAGLLLAVENLNFVQSRVSMLDIFVGFWVLLGFLLLVMDRRWIERRTPPAIDPDAREGAPTVGGLAPIAGGSLPLPPLEEDSAATVQIEPSRVERRGRRARTGVVPSPILRPWRLAAGVALGLAFSTKWSGLMAIAAAVLLSLAWERTRRRSRGVAHPVWRTIQQESFGIVVAFLLIPAVVYWGSYLGYFVHYGFGFGRWANFQGAMFSYHEHLKATKGNGDPIHPYLSRAWQWILMARPVAYYYEDSGGIRREILGMGNPAIFWTSVVAIPYAAIRWRRARDWVAGFIVIAILVQYLPWFLVSRPQFLFYITPVTPFLVLAVVYLVRGLSRVRVEPDIADDEQAHGVRPLLPIGIAIVVLCVLAFVWFYPILVGWPLSVHGWAGWSSRIWFNGSPWHAFNWV
jgi:dolichyl-phosphate-mannose-protein mannosyltransferase